ncbi:MAG: dTDP-4-dehydrorhamnose reductase [Deltaproteobacteria bacterium]|nr:dTDP-4-dehydrorhamnose reductase [Deltaproteobacteria bacterium]
MPTKPKILLTGSYGLLGSEFSTLSDEGKTNYEFLCLGRQDLDITRIDTINTIFESFRPNYVMNCTAYTQVDLAETQTDICYSINVKGVKNLAIACEKWKSKLIHYSTDFVFDGLKQSPYLESDTPHPLNLYAQSKWESEQAISKILEKNQYLILRISWPYGKNGKNFIHQMLELSKTRSSLKVVDDQIGVANPAYLLAEKSLELMLHTTGLLHLTCQGQSSRFELISFFLKSLNSNCEVVPCSSSEFPAAAKRPHYSAMASERKLIQMPTWEEALLKYIKHLLS